MKLVLWLPRQFVVEYKEIICGFVIVNDSCVGRSLLYRTWINFCFLVKFPESRKMDSRGEIVPGGRSAIGPPSPGIISLAGSNDYGDTIFADQEQTLMDTFLDLNADENLPQAGAILYTHKSSSTEESAETLERRQIDLTGDITKLRDSGKNFNLKIVSSNSYFVDPFELTSPPPRLPSTT